MSGDLAERANSWVKLVGLLLGFGIASLLWIRS
jgi:hypothetical protein